MISPWTIYFASRADAVGTLFLIVAVAAFAICLIGFDDLTKNGFKLFISIGKTGKDVIDYITDQIDKVVNDKEENKK